MNSDTHDDLNRLQRDFAALQQQMTLLRLRLDQYERRSEAAPVASAASPPALPTLAQGPLTEPVPRTPALSPSGGEGGRSAASLIPPIIPLETPFSAAPVHATPAVPPAASSEQPGASLELKLGTYWLVRIGIVMLLTGLVWAGYYAYDNFNLGAYGKLGLLYLASGVLLGLGAWLQRGKEMEAVRNFGRVVFAGGLAAVYFTTYAAHYSPSLKIIADPILAGALLLGWAGFIVWLADRKQSELLAVFALGLAFYTSAITRIGMFTLYSNLLLTVASLYLLVRNRWAGLSLASLVAAYGGFIFWRFYDDGWFWQLRHDDLQNGNLFLSGYWILFTAAGFLANTEKLARGERAAFFSFNNAAYFLLVLFSMRHVDEGHLWLFALVFGVVLMGLSLLAARRLADEAVVRRTLLAQGLFLATLGVIMKLSGLTLALLLAAESTALVVIGSLLRNPVLRSGALVCGSAAVWTAVAAWADGNMKATDGNLLWQHAPAMAFLILNVVWSKWRELEKSWATALAAVFALAATALWLFTLVADLRAPWLVPALALSGLAVFALAYGLRNYEALAGSSAFLAVALIAFAVKDALPAPTMRWLLLGCILLPLALQQLLRRHPGRVQVHEAAHYTAIILGGLALWLFVARWTILQSGGNHFYLTVSWAGLALVIFALSFLLRERMHRWLGLGILGCAVGRVVISDVWELKTPYRILSFVVLGVVLLVLGFLYTKYQQKIREWL